MTWFFIIKQIDLEISQIRLKELEVISGFNISARYDDYKESFRKVATREYATKYINIIKEIKLWLEKEI